MDILLRKTHNLERQIDDYLDLVIRGISAFQRRAQVLLQRRHRALQATSA